MSQRSASGGLILLCAVLIGVEAEYSMQLGLLPRSILSPKSSDNKTPEAACSKTYLANYKRRPKTVAGVYSSGSGAVRTTIAPGKFGYPSRQ